MVDSSSGEESVIDRREITREDFRRLYRKLFAQISRMGVPRSEVEDLIQETFMHAQQALDRGGFQGRSSFDTWMVSIAKKRTLKYFRREGAAKRSAVLVPSDEAGKLEGVSVRRPVSSEPDPQAMASDRLLLGRTVEEIRTLPESFRNPLVLSVRGHSYEQIAALLHISVARVTSRIHQAREKIRKGLAGGTRGSSG